MTEAARAQLAEEGFEPAYGARPLKRVIQQRLANPLANALLGGTMQEGDVVEIDYDGSNLHIPSGTWQHGEKVNGTRRKIGHLGSFGAGPFYRRNLGSCQKGGFRAEG